MRWHAHPSKSKGTTGVSEVTGKFTRIEWGLPEITGTITGLTLHILFSEPIPLRMLAASLVLRS